MYDDENVFAKMLRGEIPCESVYEDDNVLAFKDISPAAPVHILIIPKGQYISLNDFVQEAGPEAVSNFFETVQEIAEQQELVESGYRVIMNHGPDASQTVHHFHVHLLGGRSLGGLLPGDAQSR